MSRRPKVQYTLDTGGISSLPQDERKAILRGADELISTGGRAMLVKILKGSRDKKLLEHGLDKCPVYGFYHSLTMEEIGHRVDWVIKKGYIKIEYYGQLPMVVFSDKGWEIERETYSQELYQRFCHDVAEDHFTVIYEMKDVNRLVVFDVLEKIRAARDDRFLPILEEWKKLEVRKVRERIGEVEQTLKSHEEGPVIVFLKAQKGDLNRISRLTESALKSIYQKNYPAGALDFLLFAHNKYWVQADIEAKNVWMLMYDGKLAGTGAVRENQIIRACVLPKYENKGLEARIVTYLEKFLQTQYDRATADVPLGMEPLYEQLGYRLARQEKISIGGNISFLSKTMEKIF